MFSSIAPVSYGSLSPAYAGVAGVRPAAAAGLVAEELVATIEERTVASFRGALPGTMKADAEQASARARVMRYMWYLRGERKVGWATVQRWRRRRRRR
tara:strand:+ start:596 stop:889 length:294 start_codon:yes stop_codon:yes gene_type:complete